MNKHKVLIVDDDLNCLKLYSMICERAGYKPTAARTIDEILREIKNPYDLLILDLILPGIETSDIVKTFNKANKESKIILVTGYPDMFSSVEYMLEDYIFDYLIKPVSSGRLIETMSEALGGPHE